MRKILLDLHAILLKISPLLSLYVVGSLLYAVYIYFNALFFSSDRSIFFLLMDWVAMISSLVLAYFVYRKSLVAHCCIALLAVLFFWSGGRNISSQSKILFLSVGFAALGLVLTHLDLGEKSYKGRRGILLAVHGILRVVLVTLLLCLSFLFFLVMPLMFFGMALGGDQYSGAKAIMMVLSASCMIVSAFLVHKEKSIGWILTISNFVFLTGWVSVTSNISNSIGLQALFLLGITFATISYAVKLKIKETSS